MGTTKMTVKVYSPLMADFNRQTAALNLMRDAFLNRMIQCETPYLAEELRGKRLSPPARKYIAGSLKRLGTTPVNLVVDQETADAINKVVKETNIVRDAFINRLILFLRSSKYLMTYLELPEFIAYSDFKTFVEPMPTSPIKAIEDIHRDPFYYLRTAIQERHETGLYLVRLPPKLVGFECFLEDEYVPGTPSYEEEQRKIEDAFRELEEFESNALARTEGAAQ